MKEPTCAEMLQVKDAPVPNLEGSSTGQRPPLCPPADHHSISLPLSSPTGQIEPLHPRQLNKSSIDAKRRGIHKTNLEFQRIKVLSSLSHGCLNMTGKLLDF